MSDEVVDQNTEPKEQPQVNADELVAAMSGYNARSRNKLPAEEPEEPRQTAQPEVKTEVATPEVTSAPEPKEPQTPTLEERLAALKEEVKQLVGIDPQAVRKLNGDIGDINRRLKQLEPKPEAKPAPVDDELTAALAQAEEAAQGFPELAGPLVNVAKLLSKARQESGETASVLSKEQVAELVTQQRYNDAVSALEEEHPDFRTVRETPEFKEWFKTKPAEYQEKLNNSVNPLFVSKGLTEFKESVAKKQQTAQKKQERLASAITPQSVPAPAKPSAIPDEEGAMRGYNKVKRNTFKR